MKVGHEGGGNRLNRLRRSCASDRITTGYRVPHIVADLLAARPIDLAIVDGVESIAGGEGPWIRGVKVVKPGVLMAGLNPVCTDAVALRSWDTIPSQRRGAAPFENAITS